MLFEAFYIPRRTSITLNTDSCMNRQNNSKKLDWTASVSYISSIFFSQIYVNCLMFLSVYGRSAADFNLHLQNILLLVSTCLLVVVSMVCTIQYHCITICCVPYSTIVLPYVVYHTVPLYCILPLNGIYC